MVRDKVTHLMFGADVAQNATGMTNVGPGEIIVIGVGGAILNATAIGALGDDESFYLVQGKSASNLSHIISPKLTKNTIVAHRGTSYAADVQQVTFIGDNGTTGDINAVNDTEYSLSVSFEWDKSLYSHRRDVKHYSYTSDATATSTEIATALVALMNSDADFARQAVATLEIGGGNAGIKIVGVAQLVSDYDNPAIVSFTVALDQGFDASTRIDEKGFVYLSSAPATATGAASLAPQVGVGTYAKLKAMEQGTLGFSTGRTNFRKFPIVKEVEQVQATGTYDVYVIDFKDVHSSSDVGLDAKRTTNAQIIVANNITTTVNGSTAAVEALFAAITGVTVNL